MGEFSMIRPRDRILVGLSGGKDSLLLTYALKFLETHSPVKFSTCACLVRASAMPVDPLRAFCDALNVPLTVVDRPIMEMIASRRERSPCSFCAKLRRGILCGHAQRHGFTSLALGHNLDDAIETAYMNLFRAGRFRSFRPKSFQDRTGVWIIRPLVYAPESQIIDEVKRLNLPVVSSGCPYAGRTERQRVKEWIAETRRDFPDLMPNTLNALRKLAGADAWRGMSGTRSECSD
jgi:tRNA(Ile)-lysidine synthase TilS/MesJ